MLLTKEKILAANDFNIEKVECPEWGKDGFVYVKNMSGRGRDKFEAEFTKNKDSDNEMIPDIRSKLACLTICDKKGKLLFDYEDVEKLSLKSCAPLERIFDVSMRINKISEQDVKELEKK